MWGKHNFVDVDEHGNMCVFELEQKLQIAERAGKLPKVVTPVHLWSTMQYGQNT